MQSLTCREVDLARSTFKLHTTVWCQTKGWRERALSLETVQCSQRQRITCFSAEQRPLILPHKQEHHGGESRTNQLIKKTTSSLKSRHRPPPESIFIIPAQYLFSSRFNLAELQENKTFQQLHPRTIETPPLMVFRAHLCIGIDVYVKCTRRVPRFALSQSHNK